MSISYNVWHIILNKFKQKIYLNVILVSEEWCIFFFGIRILLSYCDRTASWDGLSRSATQLAVRPQGMMFVGLIPEGSNFISLFKTKEFLYWGTGNREDSPIKHKDLKFPRKIEEFSLEE